MISKQKLAHGEEVWRSERAEVRVRVLAPTVVLLSVKGHASNDFMPLFIGEPMRRIQQGMHIDWFGDYSEVTGYDSATRIALSEFTNKYKSGMNSIAILVRSKIVAMGVSVANLAVGGKIDAYANQQKFEAALAAAVERARAPGLSSAR